MIKHRKLQIIPAKYLDKFSFKIGFELKQNFEKINYKIFKEEIFYYNTNSVASSAKIEGEMASSQDLIHYLRHKKRFNPTYINATNDLFNAYIFAQKHTLNKNSVLKAHKILLKNLLLSHARGKLRVHDELIYNQEGRIIYTAASKEILADEFEKLIADIDELLTQELSVNSSVMICN